MESCKLPDIIKTITEYKTLIEIILSCLLAAAAIIGIVIASGQKKINQTQLSIELFKIRWEYFVTIRDFMISILGNGEIKDEDEKIYNQKMVGYKFVFDNEMESFLKEFNEKSNEFHNICATLNNTEGFEERSKVVQKRDECFKWFKDKYSSLEILFAPYLKI